MIAVLVVYCDEYEYMNTCTRVMEKNDQMYGTILVQYNEKSSLMEEIFWDFIFSDFEP